MLFLSQWWQDTRARQLWGVAPSPGAGWGPGVSPRLSLHAGSRRGCREVAGSTGLGLCCLLAITTQQLYPAHGASLGAMWGSVLPLLGIGGHLGTEEHWAPRHSQVPFVLPYQISLPQPELAVSVEGRKKMPSEWSKRWWYWVGSCMEAGPHYGLNYGGQERQMEDFSPLKWYWQLPKGIKAMLAKFKMLYLIWDKGRRDKTKCLGE